MIARPTHSQATRGHHRTRSLARARILVRSSAFTSNAFALVEHPRGLQVLIQLPGHTLQLGEVSVVGVVSIPHVTSGVREGGSPQFLPPCPLCKVAEEAAARVEAHSPSVDSRADAPGVEGLAERRHSSR